MDIYEYERMFKPKRIICANLILIVINVLVFLIDEIVYLVNGCHFLIEPGMLNGIAVANGEYYRMVTYMFLHAGLDHLFNNMLIMYFMGNFLENSLGPVRYLIIYFCSGIFAAGGSIIFNGIESSCVGASGAIFGITGALLILFILRRQELNIRVPQMLIFVGMSIYSGFTSTGVDNAAHLTGLIAGLLIALTMSVTKKSVSTPYK